MSVSWGHPGKLHRIIVESTDLAALEALRVTIPDTFFVWPPSQRWLSKCEVCNWMQEPDDPYNYFGCPECHAKTT